MRIDPEQLKEVIEQAKTTSVVASKQDTRGLTAEQFAYWLQGYLELSTAGGCDVQSIPAPQVAMIRDHLSKVFTKITNGGKPSATPIPSAGRYVGDTRTYC